MEFFKIRILFILALFAIPLFFFAQEKTLTYYADPASTPADLPVSLKHLKAEISFNPEKNEVIGKAEFTLIPFLSRIDSIVFYAPDFTIRKVEIDHRETAYKLSDKNLIIYPAPAIPRADSLAGKEVSGNVSFKKGNPVQLLISYSAKPMAGAIYFIGWRPEEAGKRKEIWAHRPHGWLPYLEARITTDMYFTFDKKYNVFSNGERLEVTENKDGTQTWHYAMKKNHPYFSTALVIGDYEYKTSKTKGGTPLEFWYYTGMDDRVAVTYKYTGEMFDFFEKELGVSYPYPLYREAPVIDYMYGAMETTTSTIFGDYMLIGPRAWWQRNYVNVNAHELAHQWFGNYISHFVNRDVWLTESFGTYYAKLFEKHIYGEDYYQNIRNDEMAQALEASTKNNFPVGGSQGGVQRIYQKGSLVLDMLRDVLGEEGFHQSIRHYLEKFGFNSAETNDFIRCIYEATGKPYHWFFDEWILRGGEPHYMVTDSAGMAGTFITVKQIQEVNELNGLFKMPVTLEVHYRDGSADSLTAWIEGKIHQILIPNPEGKTIDFILFDPGRKILKKLTYEKPVAQLLSQAMKAKQMIDRYDAWVALRSEPIESKKEFLITAFSKETFWLIKSELLMQLSAVSSPEAMEVFRLALHDQDANVRKGALLHLVIIPDLLQSTVEEMLADSSFLNVELALDGLCRSFPRNREYYLGLTKGMEGWRGKNIRMKWIEIALFNGKKEFIKELVGYSGPRYEFETRMNAFHLLKKLKYADAETLRYADMASKHWNNKLSAAAKDYLQLMSTGK